MNIEGTVLLWNSTEEDIGERRFPNGDQDSSSQEKPHTNHDKRALASAVYHILFSKQLLKGRFQSSNQGDAPDCKVNLLISKFLFVTTDSSENIVTHCSPKKSHETKTAHYIAARFTKNYKFLGKLGVLSNKLLATNMKAALDYKVRASQELRHFETLLKEDA